MSGLGCAAAMTAHGDPGNRDLLEYFRMGLDPDGNAHIVFADSIHNCDPNTCRTNTWYVKQTGGPSAYTPPAPPAPATFATNLSLPGGDGYAEPNMKADSHNCLFAAAPGVPAGAWKSSDAGFTFSQLNNVVVAVHPGGGDSDIFPFPKQSGARPDDLYYADLAVATVNISKSTDGGATWFAPGTAGAAGEVSVSTDRQWLTGDRSGANQTIYMWEHEFVSQILRMNALTNDTAWSPFASGMTDPELIAPPGSTIQNTVPGPAFVDPATHQVYGFLSASTVTTNGVGAPAGKLPNVWEADGAGTFTTGVPPGPFTNHPVFKGVIDSPISAPSPAPTPDPRAKTFGSNTSNLFNGATIDSAGNIYSTWATPSGRTGLYDVWFAASHDHGATFYGPFKISSTGIQANMPWITAGDNGRVDIVYYGTTGTEDPTTSTTNAWNVFFAQSLNAADREPVFTVSQAGDHIMHVGPICNVGILCGNNTRQLLDFFQVAIGPDGLANIAYADTGAGNGSPHISYARQNGGPLVLANPSNVTCLPAPPNPISAQSVKMHSTAGTFGIDLLPPNPGIECRIGQGSNSEDHKVVVTFAVPVTVGGATVSSSDNQATADPPIGSGTTTITVNLHNVTNAQRITITLIDVSSGAGDLGNISIPMAVLLGDVNATGNVDGNDVSEVQSHTRQIINSSNFRDDVNVTGNIDGNDVSMTQSHTRTALP